MKWLLLLALLSPPVHAVQQVSDDDCELALVSQDDYEGDGQTNWLRDENLSAREAIYREFLYGAFDYLVNHYRWPSEARADQILRDATDKYKSLHPQYEESDLNARALVADHGPGLMIDLKRWFPNRYLYVRRKLASAYIRGVRQSDLPPRLRRVPRTPPDELFFFAALKTKTNGGPTLFLDYTRDKLSLEHFRDLFVPDRPTAERTGIFPQPLLFPGGPSEVETAARFDAPFAFRVFHDTRDLLTPERAANTLRAITEAKGFIPIAWSSTNPMPRDFWESLVQYAARKNYPILIGVTQQNFEGLPEEFLNTPNVHLLTNTIENRYLKISNEPINPYIENPLVGLKKAGRYRPGQTVIVFHPHQMLETVATDTNEQLPVTLISTGGLNEPFAPFANVSQGRTRVANQEFQKTKAFVFEKSDTLTSVDPDGVQNQWQYRNIHYAGDAERSGIAGFVDLNTAYQFRYANGERSFETPSVVPTEVYFGDPHLPAMDSRFIQAFLGLGLPADANITFMAGDWVGNEEISHHMDGRAMDQNLQHQNGGNYALDAYNGGIQFINALQQRFPKARIAIDIGNHEEWLPRRLQKMPEIQDVLNGDFYDELRYAIRVLKMNIWDYLFYQRQQILESLLDRYPYKKNVILDRLLPIFDRNRLVILDRGKPYYSGPEWRRNLLSKHGDQASFGQRSPSAKQHARSMPEGGGVVGHTHQTAIYGEVMNPGTAGPVNPDYGAGFYSAVGQGLVLIYPNGTKQLLTYNRMTGSFVQRDPKKVLSPEQFFADNPLRTIANDNDRVPVDEGLELIRQEFANLRRLTGN